MSGKVYIKEYTLSTPTFINMLIKKIFKRKRRKYANKYLGRNFILNLTLKAKIWKEIKLNKIPTIVDKAMHVKRLNGRTDRNKTVIKNPKVVFNNPVNKNFKKLIIRSVK